MKSRVYSASASPRNEQEAPLAHSRGPKRCLLLNHIRGISGRACERVARPSGLVHLQGHLSNPTEELQTLLGRFDSR